MNTNVREIGSAARDSLMASVALDGEAMDQIAARTSAVTLNSATSVLLVMGDLVTASEQGDRQSRSRPNGRVTLLYLIVF